MGRHLHSILGRSAVNSEQKSRHESDTTRALSDAHSFLRSMTSLESVPPAEVGGTSVSGAVDKSEVLSVSFNQDRTCLAVATTRGVKIFSIDAGLQCVFSHSMGAVRIAEMLWSSSLLVVVGAGETHDLSPRRLKVFNTSSRLIIADLTFPDTIVAVRLDKQKLAVLESRRVIVHDLATLAVQRLIPTGLNENGIAAMTSDNANQVCLLAVPGAVRFNTNKVGPSSANHSVDKKEKKVRTVVVHDCVNHVTVCEIDAHRSQIAALALNSDGTLLATASVTGTVVRVHHLPQGDEKMTKTFRRGVRSVAVSCLTFAPKKSPSSPEFLAAASDKGTVHVFRVEGSGVDTNDKDTHPETQHSKGMEEKGYVNRAFASGFGMAKNAALLTSKVAGLALGQEFTKSASDVLNCENSVVTVHLPNVGHEHNASCAYAAAKGGFVIGGVCALRHEFDGDEESNGQDETKNKNNDSRTEVSQTSSTSSSTAQHSGQKPNPNLRVIAVNGDALLCEYSVSPLTGVSSLERERCVARAEAQAPVSATENAHDSKPKKKSVARRLDLDAQVWADRMDDTESESPKDTAFDLSQSMSASMAQSLFAPGNA